MGSPQSAVPYLLQIPLLCKERLGEVELRAYPSPL